MTRFNLPDLGEGLAEAELVRWHIKVGDKIEVDQPMVAVETAKAVVEVPSPYSGTVTALHGSPGDTIATGAALIDFELDGGADAAAAPAQLPDAPPAAGSQIRAAPAVRALAKRLGVDLTTLRGTGRSGLVTVDDVTSASPAAPDSGAQSTLTQTLPKSSAPAAPNAPAAESGKLRGLRKAMATSMALARDQVVPCTLFDDADLARWREGNDYTARLLRAIAAGCAAEPGLNAWYDGEAQTRTLNPQVDVGMAVDTREGLLVPVIRNVGGRSADDLRVEVNRLKRMSMDRTVAAEDLRDYTFMLTNFGMIAGRYATAVVVPPAVAILGAGRLSHDVVAVTGGIETHLRLPLSLTFDHRCITGGEAARFLAAVLADLQRTV